jgi:SAM-dependent methyltransferase
VRHAAIDKIRVQVEHFDSIAARYYAARRHPNHVLLKDLLWEHVLRRTPLWSGRRPIEVLEPMCGYADGKFILERHLGRQVRYTGFDYSGSVVDRLRALHPGLDVRRADVTTFEPTPSGYDVIMLLGGLHHVPDAAPKVVRRLARALKANGILISFEPTFGNPLTRKVRERIYARNSLFDATTERSFAVEELLRMFDEAGLEPVDILFPGLLSYVLYYNPDAFPRLNVGGPRMVRLTFALDRLLFRSTLGRWLSFATLSIWRRRTSSPAAGRPL